MLSTHQHTLHRICVEGKTLWDYLANNSVFPLSHITRLIQFDVIQFSAHITHAARQSPVEHRASSICNATPSGELTGMCFSWEPVPFELIDQPEN